MSEGPVPTPRVVLVDGVPMSGLLACPADAAPTAVVVAIHGGATTGAYFDCPGHPRLSLLRLGARLGYTVLALDRPGFGSSALYAEEFTDPARRTEMTYGAIDAILGDRDRGAGLFVLAHSNGTELALQLAAHPDRGRQLLGVEISGTGLNQQEAAAAVLSSASITNVPTGLRELLWEPAELYPDGIAGAVRIKAARSRRVTRAAWWPTGPRRSPNWLRGCAFRCATRWPSSSGCGQPTMPRWARSPPCSPPRRTSVRHASSTAATT